MAAKYKEYVDRMIEQNAALFDRFGEVHARYDRDGEAVQNEFNEIGWQVKEVMLEWEDKLCRQSETGGYSSFTGGLAEKFQNEVRRLYPHVDSIGITVTEPEPKQEEFVLKKIEL